MLWLNLDYQRSNFKFDDFSEKKQSKLRVILCTDLESYNARIIRPDTSIEVFFYSEDGILIKNMINNETIEFYDTDIHKLFTTMIDIEIILLDNFIYINTSDSDGESSIKLRFKIPKDVTVKYFTYDLHESHNNEITNLFLINSVEQIYLMKIFEFNKRILLKVENYFEQEMVQGNECEGIGNRKTIVRYECDKQGNNDFLVNNHHNI